MITTIILITDTTTIVQIEHFERHAPTSCGRAIQKLQTKELYKKYSYLEREGGGEGGGRERERGGGWEGG